MCPSESAVRRAHATARPGNAERMGDPGRIGYCQFVIHICRPRVRRPRGARGPGKQLSVRCELSVREVAPDRRRSEPIHQKRSFPEFSRSLLIAIRNDESLVEMTVKITKKNKN